MSALAPRSPARRLAAAALPCLLAAACASSKGATRTGPAAPQGPQWRAVLIGVSEYRTEALPGPRFGVDDSVALERVLKEGPMRATDTRVLVRRDAERKAILDATAAALAATRPGDTLVLQFSGLVTADPDDPKRIQLLTYYAREGALGLTGVELGELLGPADRWPRGATVLLVVDGLRGRPTSGALPMTSTPGALRRRAEALAKERPGLAVLLGGKKAQEGTGTLVPTRSPGDVGGNGVFAYHLALGLGGRADRDEDGAVTVAELGAYLFAAVSQATGGGQKPERFLHDAVEHTSLVRYRAAGSAPVAAARATDAAPAASGAPRKAPLATFGDFVKRYDLNCFGPLETVATPEVRNLGGGRTLTLSGYHAEVSEPGADRKAVLGVLGAIKDFGGDTEKNLREFLAWFKQEKVEAILVTGDVASDELDIRGNLKIVASAGLPVLAIIGNTETVGTFNGAIESLSEEYDNVINMNLVRRVELDGATVVGVPGYFNKAFLHETGGCLYRETHLGDTRKLAREAKSQVLLVSHGPPRSDGKEAIDYANGAGNVGDPGLGKLMEDEKIAFGAFGHILEAGGVVAGADGSTHVAEGSWQPALRFNVGQVSALPWEMNDGTTSMGMAAVLEIDGGRARVRLKKKVEGK